MYSCTLLIMLGLSTLMNKFWNSALAQPGWLTYFSAVSWTPTAFYDNEFITLGNKNKETIIARM